MMYEVDVDVLPLCIAGYLVGSIPTGFLILKYRRGIDIRDVGSHSTGATNVLRTCDRRYALATLAIDALKGIIFAAVSARVSSSSFVLLAMFLCIIGHVYPVWLKFRGGKGVSTAAGIFLVLEPCLAVVSIIVWALVAKLVKVSSIASISFALSFAGLVAYFNHLGTTTTSMLIFTMFVLTLLLITHFDNVMRLLKREESTVTEKTKSSKRCKDV
ncbi:MAG: glycerol-3-phosphate 1-O-acyltransferase PlsY [Holosporales bacterium]|jgi:glycerol-3-phosphate acyltransferase PlsY|nr:glycerol-3-phosphate 1-O-acyltransferase PlsY [Holosporales bacterium]